MGTDTVSDIFEWGRLKLDNSSEKRVKTDAERIMDDLMGENDEEDEVDNKEGEDANEEALKDEADDDDDN